MTSPPAPTIVQRTFVRRALAALVLAIGLGACAEPRDADGPSAASARAPGPLSVVATTGMIGDVAAHLVADFGSVTTLMGPGIDPHLYKASESDVRTLAGADLVLYNGLHLEGKMGDILVKMARTRPVVAVTEAIPPSSLREPPELAGQYDPHVWFDVSLWARTVDVIADALIALAPERTELVRERAEELRRTYEALDAWVAEQVATIPADQRVMVTAHDAFGYFGRRYGVEVIGLQGVSTLAEAGLRDVERVVDLVVERRIKAIFVESSVPRRTVEAVVAAAAAREHQVVIGGELFSDAMGAAGTAEGTYPGMVRHNVTTLVEALR